MILHLSHTSSSRLKTSLESVFPDSLLLALQSPARLHNMKLLPLILLTVAAAVDAAPTSPDGTLFERYIAPHIFHLHHIYHRIILTIFPDTPSHSDRNIKDPHLDLTQGPDRCPKPCVGNRQACLEVRLPGSLPSYRIPATHNKDIIDEAWDRGMQSDVL